ncbi:MAG TPA: MetS family NSS transporter small subunit [Ignavibacteria bacterium]|nr:MetS family NSS transporter small subunit [Ignavibacteria bacterium]
MDLISIITMLFITTLVWGGFLFFLSKAISKENQKRKNG